MLGLFGSSFTSVTPRSDASAELPSQSPGKPRFGQEEPPSQINLNVLPPSVDLNRPNGGRGGAGLLVPPPVVDEIPTTPRVLETYRMFGLLGLTTMEAIDRPRNALPE